MSGIATETHKYQQAIGELPCKIVDTRKTTPNFRAFEKCELKFCLLRVCYGKGDYRPFFYLFLSKTGTERVRPFLTETDCKKTAIFGGGSKRVANT